MMGNYDRQFTVAGTVISSGLGRASTGTEQVCVLFEYQDREGNTHRINWYGYFSSDKSTEIADEALKNMGWDPAAQSYSYNLLNGGDSPLIGKKVSLVLDYEDDLNGGERLKVRFVNSGGGLGLKERMSPEDAQAFAAMRRAKAGGATVSAPRPKPAGPRPAAPPVKPTAAQLAPLPGEPGYVPPTDGGGANDWSDIPFDRDPCI